MARYNTVQPTSSTTSTATLSTPGQGLFYELAGTAPYNVTIPDPTIYFGATNSFYNSTAGTISLITPNGVFKGPGSSGTNTQTITAGSTMILASDGVNYVMVLGSGGPLNGTTLNATSTVTLNPSSANVTISPTGSGTVTINPATAGNINNVAIGGTTAAAGTFTTLTLNTSMGGTGYIDGGTF